MIRLRRVPRRFRFGKVYEVEEVGEDGSLERFTTRSPLSTLEPKLGVGDAWSVIDSADRSWDGTQGEWAALYDPGVDS